MKNEKERRRNKKSKKENEERNEKKQVYKKSVEDEINIDNKTV